MSADFEKVLISPMPSVLAITCRSVDNFCSRCGNVENCEMFFGDSIPADLDETVLANLDCFWAMVKNLGGEK